MLTMGWALAQALYADCPLMALHGGLPFLDEETETQKRKGTCPRSHSWWDGAEKWTTSVGLQSRLLMKSMVGKLLTTVPKSRTLPLLIIKIHTNKVLSIRKLHLHLKSH